MPEVGKAVYDPFPVDEEWSSWEPVDLGPLLRGEHESEQPTMWVRTDGQALLYAGRVHAINAESESGKTWMALSVCVERMHRGEHVVYIDHEDGALSVVGRLLDLAVPAEVIEHKFHYVRPDEPLDDGTRKDLLARVNDCGASVVVVDGVTEAMVLHGLSIKDNDDAARFSELMLRPLQRTGAAVLVLDHVTKSKDGRGGYAIGAQHKRAGVDVVYTASVEDVFGRGRVGRSRLEVSKDRPGAIRGALADGKAAGTFVLGQGSDGQLVTAVNPSGGRGKVGRSEDGLNEEVARKVSAAVAAYGTHGLHLQAIVDTVNKRRADVVSALKWLDANQYVHKTEGGTGRATIYRSLRPYPDTSASEGGDA